MATATRSDDGCQLYGFYADVTRPDVVLSVEVWRDRAALDAHMTHAHTAGVPRVVPDLVAGDPGDALLRGRARSGGRTMSTTSAPDASP